MMIGTSAPDPHRFAEYSITVNTSTAGKTVSDPRLVSGDRTAVFVIAGQSNATNVAPDQYTPTNLAKIDNLSIYDGGTYQGKDPLIGCRNSGGNLFTRMADKLITDDIYDRVVLIPIAISATKVSEWAADPSLYDRLSVAASRANAVGLTVTAYLWQQGESETTLGTSQAAYAADLATAIGRPRANGWDAPWILAKSTYINGATSSAVRAALAAAVNGTDIFAGPDTDTLAGTAVNRQVDDTHFTTAGAIAAAALWVTAIEAAL